MSLILNMGTEPDGLVAKTDANGTYVLLGEYKISTVDMCQLALYVLTNTDLCANDPRLHFMRELAKLNPIPGWNAGRTRLGPAVVAGDHTEHVDAEA